MINLQSVINKSGMRIKFDKSLGLKKTQPKC